MNVIVLLAASGGEIVKNERKYSKLLTEINGKMVIEIVIEGLKSLITTENNIIFIISRYDNERYYLGDVIKLILPDATVIVSEGETAGAALTSLLAIEYIDEEAPLVLVNGDQLLDCNEKEVISFFVESGSDAGVIIFNSLHPRWSYVKTNKKGLVVESAEKRPISNKATAGFYFYKKSTDYIRNAKKMILKGGSTGDKYYVCPVFNEMILEQKKILTHLINLQDYHSFMSHEKIKEFEKLNSKINSNKKSVNYEEC